MDKLFLIHSPVDMYYGTYFQPFLCKCFTLQTSWHDSVNISAEYISIIKMDFFLKPKGIYTYIQWIVPAHPPKSFCQFHYILISYGHH